MMLRPVPLGAPLPEASEWSPVQRVSAEAPTTDRAQPVSFVPSTQPGTEPPLIAPQPAAPPSLVLLEQGKGEKDDAKREKDDKGKADNASTLPEPKTTNGRKGASAWPELPPPAITNPPHAPREFQKHALSAYVIEPPDVLEIQAPGIGPKTEQIMGYHLVRPDGTIGLGTLGSVFVAGMTIEQAKMRIIEKLRERLENLKPDQAWYGIKVDVAAFNSKFYYVVTDGGGYGETVIRVPFTGNETVLDAISQVQGLPVVASKHQIWLARATPYDHDHPMVLPVDWNGIVQRGSAATNYQVFPGDRIYVNSNKLIRLDSKLAKIISPIERMLGITLLGSTTVNSIKGNQGGTNR
jgi:polysaccharide export outer membrane protein